MKAYREVCISLESPVFIVLVYHNDCRMHSYLVSGVTKARKGENMKKIGLTLSLVLALGASVTAYAAAEETEGTDGTNAAVEAAVDISGDDTPVRIGRQPQHYFFYLTESLGLFEENNVDVEFIPFQSGPPLIEALGSDELDVGAFGDLPTFSGLANGGEYTVVGKLSEDTAKALVVRKDAEISQLSDLKGHTLGYQVGTNLQPLAELYLEDAGLTHDDVETVNLKNEDAATCVQNGDIDAAVLAEPLLSRALNSDEVVKLVGCEDYKTFITSVVVRNEYLEEHPNVVARILKALDEAADWSVEHPEEAKQLIAEATGTEYADVEGLFDHQDGHPFIGEKQIETLEEGVEQSLKYDLLTRDVKIRDYIDTSYLALAGITE